MRRFPLCLLCLATVAGGVHGQITGALPDNAGPIVITVRADGPSTPIPETIFGSFLEPIGKSTYNGLWAELLENPSFEPELWSASHVAAMIHSHPELARGSDLDLPLPWAPLYADEGNRYEPRRGDAANSQQSLALLGLPHDGPHGGETGVRQRVYLPAQRQSQYVGSLWIKHLSGPEDVEVSIRKRDHPEVILARVSVHAAAAQWTQYPFRLELPPFRLQPREPADFVIAVRDNARTLVDQASLMPADAIDGMDPDVVGMAKDLRSPVVRFGGNFTSSYHWRDGVGPREKRVSMQNLAWGIPEYNTFGTDEFLRFCEDIGAQPQVALNLGTGTPEEAADWVRYIDASWGDRKGGLLWELGNELWGNWNTGYPELSELGERVTSFSQAVHRVDPTARLIAPGADEDFFHDWNAQLLSTPPGSFQYMATHFVVTGTQLQTPQPSAEFMALANFALPVGLGGRMREMAAQMAASTHKEAKIAFTEWLFAGRTGVAPDFKNLGGGIETAGFLNMLMRNADVVPVSDMTGILDFAGISKSEGQVYGAPGYWVLRMYANAQPRKLLSVENGSPTYTVEHGVTRLPSIANVPWLEVQAAEGVDPDHLLLFCVNRSLTRDLRATVHLRGFAAASQARVQTLTAASIYEENSAEEPEAVTPHSSLVGGGAEIDHVFPRASVVVIELTRKGK